MGIFVIMRIPQKNGELSSVMDDWMAWLAAGTV
jgi:hypothetical protein